MATMKESDLLRLAREAVPEHIRPLGRIVRRRKAPGAEIAGMAAKAGPPDAALIAALAEKVGATPGKREPNSADVEFPEQTRLGLRTTVVHIRNGKVTRVIKRG